MEPVEIRRESTVKDFLEIVFRRKWIIVGIVAAATVTAIIMSLREPAVYESSAKVLIKRGEPPGVFDRGVRTLEWEEEIASQIEMVRSQTVIDRAQEIIPQFYPKGYETDLRVQMAQVSSGVVTTSNVLWVTYNAGDPVFCQAAVNAVVTAYKEYYTNTRTPPEMEDFFSGELQRTREEIDYWREHKAKVLREGNIVDLDAQRKTLLARLDSYGKEYDDIVRDRKEKEAIIARLENLLAGRVEDAAAVSSDLTGSALEQDLSRDLRAKLHDLRIKESEMAGRFTEQNMDLVRLRAQIADLEKMIAEESETQLLVNKSQLGIIIQRETTLRELLSRLSAEREQYPRNELELDRIDVSLQKLQQTYAEVQAQHMNARISRASNPEWTITIINPASAAYQKKTRDYVRLALGPAFSLIVALGLAFFVDNLDHSIKNIHEAEANLRMSVLASIPEMNRK